MKLDMKYKRWLLPLLVGLVLFGNHYVRDSLGALEKQMEKELKLSDQDYSNLNAVYFLPNIITPILAGMLTVGFGGVSICFLYSVIIASFGHLLFGIGIHFSNKSLIFLGRGIGGSMYEIVDAMMPITYLGPLFESEFQIVVGFFQIFWNMGSIVNFIVSPYLFLHYDLYVAFWVACLIGIASVPLFMCARSIEFEYIKYKKDSRSNNNSLDNSSHNEESGLGSTKAPSHAAVSSKSSSHTMHTAHGIHNTHATHAANGHHSSHVLLSPSSSSSTPHGEMTPPPPLKGLVAKNKSSAPPSLLDMFLESMPLHKFSLQFYLYLLSGSFMYGSLMPFWFIGSRYMQDRLHISVSIAGSVMTIPIALVMLVGFPLGLVVSRYEWVTRTKLIGMCVSMVGVAVAYVLLLISTFILRDIPTQYAMYLPAASVFLLGGSFAFACSLFWGAITEVAGVEHLSPATGLISCGVNLLPAIVPSILATLTNGEKHSNVSIIALAGMAGVSALCALGAAYPSYIECVVTGVSCASKRPKEHASPRSMTPRGPSAKNIAMSGRYEVVSSAESRVSDGQDEDDYF